MGDDNELSSLAKQIYSRPEAVHVCLVERRINLVEHAERRRADAEDGEHKGAGGQRALATGEELQVLGTLSREAGMDLDTGVKNISRIGHCKLCPSTLEEQLEETNELFRDSIEGPTEVTLHSTVQFTDNTQEVTGRIFEVIRLTLEKVVPVGNFLVLLRSLRVDTAQAPDACASFLDVIP